jgi:hypothetical protein
MTYEARKNTDFSLRGCVDQAGNTLENLQTENSGDNVSEPYEYLKESDSKETISNTEEEEDVVLNTYVFIFC